MVKTRIESDIRGTLWAVYVSAGKQTFVSLHDSKEAAEVHAAQWVA